MERSTLSLPKTPVGRPQDEALTCHKQQRRAKSREKDKMDMETVLFILLEKVGRRQPRWFEKLSGAGSGTPAAVW